MRTYAWIVCACILEILFLWAGLACAAENDCDWDFQRGRAMAHALTKGYGVYEVVIKKAAPWVTEPDERGAAYGLQHQDLTVTQAREPLHAGTNRPGKEFVLTAFRRPEITKTSMGPWSTWDGIEAHEGDTLVVVYRSDAPEAPPLPGQGKGQTALAMAAPVGGTLNSLTRVLQHYAHAGKWFEKESVRVLLADKQNIEGEAGYLLGWLKTGPNDTAASAALLEIASGTTNEPSALYLLDYLMTESRHGSAEFRQKVCDAVLTIALRDDPASKAGLQVILAAASNGDFDAVKGATAEQRAGLIQKARRLAPVGLFQQRFESALKNLEGFVATGTK